MELRDTSQVGCGNEVRQRVDGSILHRDGTSGWGEGSERKLWPVLHVLLLKSLGGPQGGIVWHAAARGSLGSGASSEQEVTGGVEERAQRGGPE